MRKTYEGCYMRSITCGIMIHCALRDVTARTERMMKETQFVQDVLEVTR